ncbi:MAG: copper homeostasis protein CutC [Hyphomicrobiales bacterium]|nr:copper homeostasis protein CutC [Hyphomicrobiales bacterium]MCP5000217.1 copper homeostasis protein CutC [Hyphomicrobiales bacterium]
MTGVSVEVCVDNSQSLLTCIDAGVDRIELCSALELGGLTPGDGLMRLAAHSTVPVYAMIRPRAGDFEFDDNENALMTDEIRHCGAAGLSGVVIGASCNGTLDVAKLEKMMDAAGGLGVTLHRVFDLVDDPLRTIDMAVGLGIERILTSGGSATAHSGIENIRRYVEHTDGRLSIMAGGGINDANALEIVRRTGVHEIHGSFSRETRRYSTSIQKFDFSTTDVHCDTDIASIRAVRAALDDM